MLGELTLTLIIIQCPLSLMTLFHLKPILFDKSMASNSVLFCLPSAQNNFFNPFTFSPHVSLDVMSLEDSI